MTNALQIHNDIESVVRDLSLVFSSMKSVADMYDDTIDRMNHQCMGIPDQVRSGILHIAVVGAIKSGKSTFINAWLKKDLLKRGAGVITSIVTRVRKGPVPKASILMKSWDEINHELEKALILFPDMDTLNPGSRGFDLRRKHDRDLLSNLCRQQQLRHAIARDGFRQESMTIIRAINGYETAKGYVHADPSWVCFSGREFDWHKQFTGDESVSFFVRDVTLETDCTGIDEQVEIADCQGSDSTDPAHMAQIQDYLVSANLIVYLISSRTGLREADLIFLKQIELMGLKDNILFVINADISEHDCLEDLIAIEKRTVRDLSYLFGDPVVYAVSSLVTLLESSFETLSDRDRKRLDLWKSDTDLFGYTTANNARLKQKLEDKISRERFLLLVSNPVERIRIVIRALDKRIRFFSDLFITDKTHAAMAMEKLSTLLDQSKKLEIIMKNSLDGAIRGLKNDMDTRTAAFFNKNNGPVVETVRRFIRGYFVDLDQYAGELTRSGFQNAMYIMFQDFQKSLDTCLTLEVNPEIHRFINQQETRIQTYFESLYQSFHVDPQAIYSNFSSRSNALHETVNAQELPGNPVINIDYIKGILDLKIPDALSTTRYSAKIKLDSMARFGFHTFTGLVARVFFSRTVFPGQSALRDAGIAIKRETLRSVLAHLDEYRNLIDADYFSKLVNAVARDFQDKLMERFKVCDVEIETIERLINLEQYEKTAQTRVLETMDASLKMAVKAIDAMEINYLN
ncbi:MAG: dynamin family protein [Pseudomonadota bacterium]